MRDPYVIIDHGATAVGLGQVPAAHKESAVIRGTWRVTHTRTHIHTRTRTRTRAKGYSQNEVGDSAAEDGALGQRHSSVGAKARKEDEDGHEETPSTHPATGRQKRSHKDEET